jgi:hypothetical protein
MLRALVRRVIFENMGPALGILIGVMQVVVGHWVIVVFGGGPGPSPRVAFLLGAALVVANVLVTPALRGALRAPGLARSIARAYLALGLATVFVGAALVAAWAGFLPVATLLGAAGVGSSAALDVFRIATVPIVAALAFMIVWGFTVGQSKIEREVVRIELAGLPAPLRGMRVVQISDLHIGNEMERARLDGLVADVNALEPDLVAITGDIFDYDPSYVEDGARRLAGLRARYGVYAVLGNHDVMTGRERVASALRAHAPELRLLRGESVRAPAPAPFYVAGVEDPGREGGDWHGPGMPFPGLAELGRALPTDGPTLLLVHRPEAFPEAARLGFPLVLAGHTHGGQVALPTPGGRLNPARLFTRFHRGLYHHDEHRSILYVNRGVGVAGPAIRFNCPREIATVELC